MPLLDPLLVLLLFVLFNAVLYLLLGILRLTGKVPLPFYLTVSVAGAVSAALVMGVLSASRIPGGFGVGEGALWAIAGLFMLLGVAVVDALFAVGIYGLGQAGAWVFHQAIPIPAERPSRPVFRYVEERRAEVAPPAPPAVAEVPRPEPEPSAAEPVAERPAPLPVPEAAATPPPPPVEREEQVPEDVGEEAAPPPAPPPGPGPERETEPEAGPPPGPAQEPAQAPIEIGAVAGPDERSAPPPVEPEPVSPPQEATAEPAEKAEVAEPAEAPEPIRTEGTGKQPDEPRGRVLTVREKRLIAMERRRLQRRVEEEKRRRADLEAWGD